jgi:hypothetical protein
VIENNEDARLTDFGRQESSFGFGLSSRRRADRQTAHDHATRSATMASAMAHTPERRVALDTGLCNQGASAPLEGTTGMETSDKGFTPGPWAVSGARTIDGCAIVVGAGGFGVVAEVTLDADARLIASALEMLEELKRLRQVLKAAGYPTDDTDEIIAKAAHRP